MDDDLSDWRDDAACAEVPTRVFFPGPVGPGELNDSEVARLFCEPCPVRAECLEFALANRIRFGVWGGKTETQRRAILRSRNGPMPSRARRGRPRKGPPNRGDATAPGS